MDGVELNHYLFVGAVLFVCGVVCMATKRNGIGVLMGVELVLNGANVNFVAFSRYTPLGLDGQVISLFVIVLAAAEAAVALAIALNYYNNHQTIDVDRGDQLHG
jgi:NADH:ubiquinone oxidoreductase subunit K